MQHRSDIDVSVFPGPLGIIVPQVYGEVNGCFESQQDWDPSRQVDQAVLFRDLTLRHGQVCAAGSIVNELEFGPAPTKVLDREQAWRLPFEHLTLKCHSIGELEVNGPLVFRRLGRPERFSSLLSRKGCKRGARSDEFATVFGLGDRDRS
jgi:hypothetical protein